MSPEERWGLCYECMRTKATDRRKGEYISKKQALAEPRETTNVAAREKKCNWQSSEP